MSITEDKQAAEDTARMSSQLSSGEYRIARDFAIDDEVVVRGGWEKVTGVRTYDHGQRTEILTTGAAVRCGSHFPLRKR